MKDSKDTPVPFFAERLAEKICLYHGFYHHKPEVQKLIESALEETYQRGRQDEAAERKK